MSASTNRHKTNNWIWEFDYLRKQQLDTLRTEWSRHSLTSALRFFAADAATPALSIYNISGWPTAG